MRSVSFFTACLINSRIFISLSALLLCLHTNLQLGQPLDGPFACFAFFSTFFCYRLFSESLLLQRGWKAVSGSTEIITLLAGIIAFLLLFLIEPAQQKYLIPAVIFALLYAIPLFESSAIAMQKAAKLLPGRQKGLSKLLLICLTWSWTTVVLPYAGRPDNIPYLILAGSVVSRALFIAGLTIPFDIRDRLLDGPNMKTIPQRFGVNTSLFIAVFALLLAALLLICLAFRHAQASPFFLAEAAGTVVAIPLILASPKQPAGLYFTGILDGLLVLTPLFSLVIKGFQ
jgi:hypothetical protein